MTLTMAFLDGTVLGGSHVSKPFAVTSGFKSAWWTDVAVGPLVFVTFTHDVDGEVVRAEVKRESFTGSAFPDWVRPEGAVAEVQLFEVRADVRGRGHGRAAVDLLLEEFSPPVIAVAIDSDAASFWRNVGWLEYAQEPDPCAHPDDEKPRPLFVRS